MEIVQQTLSVDGVEVNLTPNPQHEYLMTTEQVALGYGVGEEGIRSHKARRPDELIEGKHWVAVANSNAAGTVTLWTKRGIVRLGFFIRSARARKFRDMAEDLVIGDLEHPTQPAAPQLATARAIGAAIGSSYGAVLNALQRAFIHPTASGLSSRNAPCYLFLLTDVTAFYSDRLDAPIQPYTGRTLPLAAARDHAVRGVQTRTLPRPQQQRLLPSTDRPALARELVALEERRAEILAALA